MKQNKFRNCKSAFFVIGFITLFFGIILQANAAPQLELGSATISQGRTGILNLSFSGGTEPYAGVNARIILPNGITVTGISSPTKFITSYNQSENELTVIGYSGTNTISTSSILFNLSLEADNTVAAGNYPISFATTNPNSLVNSKYALSNTDGSQSIEPKTTTGEIIISQTSSEDSDNDGLSDEWEKQYFNDLTQDGNGDYDNDGITNAQEHTDGTDPTIPDRGDINGDNKITIADAVVGLKILCAIPNPGTFKLSADINEDGKIGMEEIVFILQRIADN